MFIYIIYVCIYIYTQWRIWLRQCPKSRKAVVSNPLRVINLILPGLLWPWSRLSL